MFCKKAGHKRQKEIAKKEKMMYLSLIFDINFGPTSLFNEQLKQMEIINSNIEISSVGACNHVVYTLFLETESKEKAIELFWTRDEFAGN